MIYRSLVRALVTSAALAASVMLAGCNSDEISLASNAKANQPVPPKLIQAMVDKDMDLNSPILVRLFKQEAELEIWKQDRSGRFALLKSYPICRWSGDLGPKIRDRASKFPRSARRSSCSSRAKSNRHAPSAASRCGRAPCRMRLGSRY